MGVPDQAKSRLGTRLHQTFEKYRMTKSQVRKRLVHRAEIGVPNDSFMKLDFRFYFPLIIYTRFDVKRSQDGRNPQENCAARKMSSRTDPA